MKVPLAHAKAGSRASEMRPPMMNKFAMEISSLAEMRARDEDTEIEPLGNPVSSERAGNGQTRVTFVENESTDDD